MSPRGQLVGRGVELELIHERLGEARSGAGGVVMIAGEPGIGKTRLMLEAAFLAESMGVIRVWGRCREDGGAPAFLPWVQILRSGIEQHGEDPDHWERHWPELVSLLQPVTGGQAEPAEPSARFRMLVSITEALAFLGRRSGLLALVDDLHRADQASLSVLEYLAAEVSRLPVLVVGAYRDTEVAADRALAGPLASVVEAAAAPVVRLEGLGREEVSVLIDHHAGPVGDSVAHAVAERTGGNPLFVIEVARLLRNNPGTMEQVAKTEIPPTILALIHSRVNRLPRETRLALEAAAVLGRDFGRLPLAQMLATTDMAAAAALQPAASTGIISPSPAGMYRFTHALIQSAIYESLPVPDRAAWHRRATTALMEGTGEDDQRVSDLAFHSYCALIDGNMGPGLEHLLAAGRRARRRLAFDEAALWLSRALEVAERTRVGPVQHLGMLLELADAERDAGQTASARRHYERGAEMARSVELGEVLTRCALGVGSTVVTAGRVDWDLVRLLEEASAGAVTESGRARLESRLAIELYWHQGGEPARAKSLDALARAEASGDLATIGIALHAHQFTLRGPGHLAERIAIGERLIDAGDGRGQAELDFQGRVWLAADVLRAGDLSRFRQLIGDLDAISSRSRLPLQRWYTMVMQGQLAALEGRIDDAFDLTEQAGELGARMAVDLAPAYRLGQLCVLCRERGGLQQVADEIRRLGQRLPYFVTIRSFGALAAATTGHADVARWEIHALSATGFAAVPRDSLWVATMALLSEAAAISGSPHTAELVTALTPLRGTLVVNGLPNCWGSADRFLGRACLALGDLVAADGHLRSAASLEESAGLPVHLARTQMDQARLGLARHQPEAARALLAQVRDVAASLRLDALDREAESLLLQPTPRSGLSRREQEVLHQLSRGASNKEIAAALVISLNTVERHLSNIYTKLGIRGRAEAAVYAVRAESTTTPGNGGLP